MSEGKVLPPKLISCRSCWACSLWMAQLGSAADSAESCSALTEMLLIERLVRVPIAYSGVRSSMGLPSRYSVRSPDSEVRGVRSRIRLPLRLSVTSPPSADRPEISSRLFPASESESSPYSCSTSSSTSSPSPILSSTSRVVPMRYCLPATVTRSAAFRLFRVLSIASILPETTPLRVSMERRTSSALA